MIAIFLFLLSIIAIAFALFYHSNTVTQQRRQILLLSRQANTLKSKITDTKTSSDDIIVKYITPAIQAGKTLYPCSIYLAPLESSAILSRIPRETPIIILDSAEIFSTLWYEISLQSADRINNKGWVKASFIKKEEELSLNL